MAQKPAVPDLFSLASCVDTLQEANSILCDELAEQGGQIDSLCRTNAALVHAINNAWTILDRLTGREPDPLVFPKLHHHAWEFVCPATFYDAYREAVGQGVSERCACGARRSRMTTFFHQGDDLYA